jgi:hypothetical protein
MKEGGSHDLCFEGDKTFIFSRTRSTGFTTDLGSYKVAFVLFQSGPVPLRYTAV